MDARRTFRDGKARGRVLYWSLSSPHPHSAHGETEACGGEITSKGRIIIIVNMRKRQVALVPLILTTTL